MFRVIIYNLGLTYLWKTTVLLFVLQHFSSKRHVLKSCQFYSPQIKFIFYFEKKTLLLNFSSEKLSSHSVGLTYLWKTTVLLFVLQNFSSKRHALKSRKTDRWRHPSSCSKVGSFLARAHLIYEFKIWYLDLRFDIWIQYLIFKFNIRYLNSRFDIWIQDLIFKSKIWYFNSRFDI